MKIKAAWIRNMILTGSYIYLVVPVVLFFLGWCKWYIGIPAAGITVVSLWLCLKERREETDTWYKLGIKQWIWIVLMVVLVLVWVFWSGIGGYVWQNADHPVRNEIFLLLVEEKWPLVAEMEMPIGAQLRGMVYYIGFWLPAAVIGKIFGIEAGWAAQYVWAVIGILLMYALICIWRKKVSIWPLMIVICFSGLDAVGMLVWDPANFQLFGELSIDPWPKAYQFSSMTTQLFWVFNQALPAWLLAALVFLGEKPRNMVFLSVLTILTSTLPFAGMLPFVCYFMITRSKWGTDYKQVRQILEDCWQNWGSFQNVAGGGVTLLICTTYVLGNDSVLGSLNIGQLAMLIAGGVFIFACLFFILTTLALKGWGARLKKLALIVGILAVLARCVSVTGWPTPFHYGIFLTFFYVVDAGILLAVLFPLVEDKRLFALNGIWLYIIPMIIVGNSCDFCMRASIPGLFLMMLWSIQAISHWKKKAWTILLIGLLCIGAITPFHEIKRSVVNTSSPYENLVVEKRDILCGSNFSGEVRGFFWNYIAKPVSGN